MQERKTWQIYIIIKFLERIREYLNELLAKLNDAEIETYREIEYQERVIEMGGDIKGAKASFDEELARRDGEFDLISTMIGWVYDFSNEDVNGQMRLNMFTLLKSFQEKAVARPFSYIPFFSRVWGPAQSLAPACCCPTDSDVKMLF